MIRRALGWPLRLLWGAALCLLVTVADCSNTLFGTPARTATVRIGVVWWPARLVLDSAWRADTVLESAWCVVDASTFPYPDPTRADTIIRVYQVAPAAMTKRDRLGVDYPPCPGRQPELHTHPPQDGVTTCDPTRIDRETLARRRKPWGIVQCGPGAFRFFFPDEDTP